MLCSPAVGLLCRGEQVTSNSRCSSKISGSRRSIPLAGCPGTQATQRDIQSPVDIVTGKGPSHSQCCATHPDLPTTLPIAAYISISTRHIFEHITEVRYLLPYPFYPFAYNLLLAHSPPALLHPLTPPTFHFLIRSTQLNSNSTSLPCLPQQPLCSHQTKLYRDQRREK